MAEQLMSLFMYVFTKVHPEIVTNLTTWTDEDRRTYAAHVAYLQRGGAEGIVVVAGRALDGDGPAVCIFEAASEDAARAFMEADPFVTGGIMRAKLHRFGAAFARRNGAE